MFYYLAMRKEEEKTRKKNQVDRILKRQNKKFTQYYFIKII